MQIRLLQHGDSEYNEMLILRMKVLLDPIGIPRSYINIEKETDDIHIGAFDENLLVGCCVLTKRDEDAMQLRQMAVDPQAQHRGLGAAIVKFAENVAKEQGYNTVMMHARDTVTGFYEKCGYVKVGEPFLEVGIRHFVMEKEIV